ncbi:LacI family DNA-binding transcriptional regulator [Gracilimonas mengyeensis]|uniref:Transcriptional regulator, LacI family n=1 Tax=Gracilimonas mengyeensis TaxID=1302730 RepID=A0A521FDI9_9BACT|nr:LacI family DNA-binding transcriptional regulator [Gracilimonas mengyeensis]SMO94272.1 transcriptional regulator, LacI family [Gracilimonas mengyeensis]
MSTKKTTIHDIAKELDITASTVSRALKDHPRISDATKKAVLEMAEKMNYQPNSIAAALRRGTSNLIGVIIPTADRNFFASVIRGIEDVLNDTSYNVIICQSNDSVGKEKKNIQALLEARVDGIFASYAKETLDFSHYEDVQKSGIPLILFDRMQNAFDVDAVVIDDYLGAFKATEHLIDQGCRKIVHFSGPENVSIYRDRRRGYEEALKKHGIPINKEFIISSDLKLEAGKRLGNEIAGWDELPDGIFSASDYAAMGAMEILKKHDIRVPEDIALVGFSNEAFTELVDPALSTVDQHSKKMGKFTANLFLERIKDKEESGKEHTPTKTVLNPELIIRKSSLKKVPTNA